jgi:uncharacterized iron-regulated protein
MRSEAANAYYEQKIKLLAQCIKLSEEVFGCLDSEEDLQGFLSRRKHVLLQLKLLDENSDHEVMLSCSKAQKEQIDQQVTLLLAMDRDIAKSISANQKTLLEEIKENKKRQRIANYATP